jgi:thiamine pyrophosphokinase
MVNPVPLSAMPPKRHVIRTPIAVVTSSEDEEDGCCSTAMIILNAPLRPTRLFHTLWGVAKYRICADGAANRLRSLNERHLQNASLSVSSANTWGGATITPSANDEGGTMRLVPNLIIGDLDSITDETKAYYRDVRTVQVLDQDRNDLDKALEAAAAYRRVVVFGAFGGRLDQQMASIQALYCYPDREIFLYDDTSMAVLVPAGETSIFLATTTSTTTTSTTTNTQHAVVSEGPTCGLIPVGRPVRSITTTGLQWNLHEQGMEFGGLVSTSNRVVPDNREVTIVSSEPLVFTAELHCGCATTWSEP